MCSVCGCGHGEVRIETKGGHPDTPRPEGHRHSDHAHHHGHHDNSHDHSDDDHAHSEMGALRVEPTGTGADGARLLKVEEDILSKNNAIAAHNRAHFSSSSVLALNLVSSPGAGKTTLLVETLKRLGQTTPAAVIEGDQETTADADRIRETGVPAIQINTGKGCHLDADMVHRAFHGLALQDGVLFIENVGNLVCPAGFDLGEAHKVVIASVTEGEDKPLKYPNMFAAASLMLVAKTDLLPHLDFDVDALIANAKRVNPSISVVLVSAKSGEGMERWLAWIAAAAAMAKAVAS